MTDYKHYVVIFSGVFLLVVLLLFEARRLNKANLLWRIIANVVAVLSLVLLIVPLSYKVETVSAKSLNIFTEGTDSDAVPKAYKSGYAIQAIPDLSYLLKGRPEIKSINVFGYGLKTSDLEQTSRYDFHYYPTKPKGLISVHWNTRIIYTKKLVLQGTYVNSSSREVRLILRGFGTNLDSVRIPVGKTFKFSLSGIPKQSGKAIFELQAFSQEQLLTREMVPIEVVESKPLNILLLSSNPDFEYKFLKNWLFDEGHSVMLRSRISRNALSFDFLNVKPLDLNRITGPMLNKVDVLIGDETEFLLMNSQESRLIEQAVSEGMGLLVRISEGVQPKGANLTTQFLRYEVPGMSDKDEQKLFLKSSSASLQIRKDELGRVLTERTLHGRGNVAGSVLLNTYTWLLAGKAAMYNAYWSGVVGDLARIKPNKVQYEISPQVPLSGEPIRIVVRQSKNDVPTIKLNEELLAPRQNVALPFEWDVISLAVQHGWNKIDINGEQASFFVFDKGSWQDLKNNNTSILNVSVSSLSESISDVNGIARMTDKKLPLWIFFISFLFSVGFLWLEPKLLLRNQ
ncbi:MAG: hypothetical protein WKF66_11265 [Pedobacter sp.]